MNIVCDTNIWYYIGSGQIRNEEFKDHRLVATFNNFFEIGNSPNLYQNTQVLKNAISAIIENASDLVFTDHYDYIANIYLSDFNPNDDIGEFMYSELLRINSLTIAELESGVKFSIENIQNNVSEIRKNIGEVTKFTNEKAREIKENIKKSIGKAPHRLIDRSDQAAEFISFLVQKKTQTNLNITDLAPIALFANTMAEFFKDVELGAVKIHDNDWIDLFNMAYVQEGALYWTREKKWLKYIRKAGLGRFLFEDPALPDL